MDAESDDPEPGPPAQRAVFYGLWPRFAAGEEERADVEDTLGDGPAGA